MSKPSAQMIYEFEDFRLDTAHLMLYRGDEEISLAPKAVRTLLTLIERRGEIISKDELMETIWSDSIVEEANLTQYVHVLRKTLGAAANGKPLIETLRRRGYRFNGDVRCVHAQIAKPDFLRDLSEPPAVAGGLALAGKTPNQILNPPATAGGSDLWVNAVWR